MSERRQVIVDLITHTAAGKAGVTQLRSDLGGIDGASKGAVKGITNVGTASGNAGKGVRGLTSGLGASRFAMGGIAAGALAVGAGIKASIGAFASFDDKLTQSQAIMGDLTDSMKTGMSDAAREVAKTTRISADQAAESFFFLASAGLDASQSIAALPQVAAFAQAGMFDMATATDLLTDAQSALGLTVGDSQQNLQNMTKVSDIFVRSNQLANTSVQQVSEAITNKLGGSLRAAGIDLEEGVAVLAAFADQGLKGAAAGESMNIALRDLSKASRENKETFAENNIAVFDSEGNFRNMADVISDLEGAFGGLTAEQQANLASQLGFQDRSFKNIQLLLGTSDAVRKYEKELRSAGGATKEVADNQLDSFSAQLDLAKSRVKDAGITIGEQLAPAALAAASSIADLVENIEPLIGLLGKGIELWSDFGPLQLFGNAVSRVRGIFDETVKVANDHNDVMAEVRNRMEDGGKGADEFFNGLTSLVAGSQMSAEAITELADITGLAGQELVDATTKVLDFARESGGSAMEIANLEQALRNQIEALGLDEEATLALMDANGLLASEMDQSADAVLRMKAGTSELTEAEEDLADQTGDTEAEILDLGDALRAAHNAQTSLADAMRAFADPTFAAASAVQKMRDAQEKLIEVQKDTESSADDIAEAQLDLALATLEAQGALDAFSGQNLNDQITVIADALGISKDEAALLFEQLGLIDGATVQATIALQVKARDANLLAGLAQGFKGKNVNFFAKGGRPGVNEVSVVGEKGPELFVPDRAGTIVPNSGIGMMNQTTTNVTEIHIHNPQHRDDDVVDGIAKSMQLVGMTQFAETTPGRA